MSLKYLLLTLLTLQATLGVITERDGFTDASMYKTDLLVWDLNRVFNCDAIEYPGKFTQSIGRHIAIDTPLYLKNVERFSFLELSYFKKINHKLVGVVYDKNQVLIQELKLDGHFGRREYKFNFNLWGQDFICNDMIENPEREILYVVCNTHNSSDLHPGEVLIHEIDLKTGDHSHTVKIKQDDGFRIKNRAQLRIIYNPAEISEFEQKEKKDFLKNGTRQNLRKKTPKNADEYFLLIYDQGFSRSLQTRENYHVRILAGVESGRLISRGLIELDLDLTALYDIFSYKTGIILTGRTPSAGKVISLTSCRFNIYKLHSICTKKFKATTLTEGWVGLFNNEQYIQLDTKTQHLIVANVKGDVHDPDWNSDIRYTYDGFALFHDENIAIRDYSGGDTAGIINWIHGGSVHDHGVSIHVLDDPNITTIELLVGVMYDDMLVSSFVPQPAGDSFIFNIRMQSPSLLIAADKIRGGKNAVRLSATDHSHSPKVYATGSVFVWEHPFEHIEVEDNIPSEIVIRAGDRIELPGFDPVKDIIKGNGIHVDSLISSENENALQIEVYQDFEFTVDWMPSSIAENFEEVIFEGKRAVTRAGSILSEFECYRDSLTKQTCRLTHEFSIGDEYRLQQHIQTFRQYTLAWLQSPSDTAIVLFDSKNRQEYVHKLKGKIGSVYLSHKEDETWLGVTYTDKIEFYWVDPESEDRFELFYTLDQKNSGTEFFCPTEIQNCPRNPKILWVMSSCPEEDQRAIRYKGTEFEFKTSIPVNLDHPSPSFCSTGPEGIFSSIESNFIEGKNHNFDENKYSYPVKDMGIEQLTDVTCLPGLETLVASGFDRNLGPVVAVFNGNQGRNFNRRISNYFSLEQYKPTRWNSYELDDGIIYVVYGTDEKIHYHYSLKDGPKIFLKASRDVKKETPVDLSIVFETSRTKKIIAGKTVKIVVNGIEEVEI